MLFWIVVLPILTALVFSQRSWRPYKRDELTAQASYGSTRSEHSGLDSRSDSDSESEAPLLSVAEAREVATPPPRPPAAPLQHPRLATSRYSELCDL